MPIARPEFLIFHERIDAEHGKEIGKPIADGSESVGKRVGYQGRRKEKRQAEAADRLAFEPEQIQNKQEARDKQNQSRDGGDRFCVHAHEKPVDTGEHPSSGGKLRRACAMIILVPKPVKGIGELLGHHQRIEYRPVKKPKDCAAAILPTKTRGICLQTGADGGSRPGRGMILHGLSPLQLVIDFSALAQVDNMADGMRHVFCFNICLFQAYTTFYHIQFGYTII